MNILLLGAFLLLTNGQTAGINFFSVKQDIEIGSESSKDAEKALALVKDANLNRYFRSIGARLIHTGSAPSLQYRFRIVNSKEINSLGFPGGAIYVNRGLIETAANDSELAAIIAHEIGHVASRHGTAQLSRQLLVQAPTSIAAGLPSTEGWKEQLTKLGVSFGVDASFLRYSRDQEIEANVMAVRLLSAARFEPRALESLLEKINEVKNGETSRLPSYVFNHPQSENLQKEIAAEIERVDPVEKRTHASVDFRTFRSALHKLPPPPAGKEITLPLASDAPMTEFRHPLEYYQLRYPSEWQITRTGPHGAIIAPVDGVQQSRAGDDITHGAIFDLFDLSTSEKPLTLEQATNRLIVFLRQRNQSLLAVPGAQIPTLVSDEPGLRTVLIGKSNTTNSTEVIWVVTRTYYQSLFYLIFVAPEEEFSAYQPIFEQIIRSTRLR